MIQYIIYLYFFIGSTVLFNYFINPYGVFQNRIDIPEKVFLKSQERLWKVRAITRAKPNALLLGSSRTRDGFDAMNNYFADGNNWFNSAVNGGNIYEMWHYYEHALSNNKINKMLIGVDFFMFNAYHKGRDFLPRYFFKKNDLRWSSSLSKKSITQLASTLISYGALSDSLSTLIGEAFFEQKQKQDENTGFMIREYTKVAEDYSFLEMEKAFLKEFWFPEPETSFHLSGVMAIHHLTTIIKYLNQLTRMELLLLFLYLQVMPDFGKIYIKLGLVINGNNGNEN